MSLHSYPKQCAIHTVNNERLFRNQKPKQTAQHLKRVILIIWLNKTSRIKENVGETCCQVAVYILPCYLPSTEPTFAKIICNATTKYKVEAIDRNQRLVQIFGTSIFQRNRNNSVYNNKSWSMSRISLEFSLDNHNTPNANSWFNCGTDRPQQEILGSS